MGKRQKDLCPFNNWRAREGNSECTGVVNVFKVQRQKDICMGKSKRECVLLIIAVLSMSSKSGDKRTYLWGKGKRTGVLLTIGGQEREIQNAQALSMSSKSEGKRTYVWAKARGNVSF